MHIAPKKKTRDKNYQWYISVDGELVAVSEEIYREYWRPIWREWKRAHHEHRCAINNWRKCRGDCGLCSYNQIQDASEMLLYLPDPYGSPEAIFFGKEEVKEKQNLIGHIKDIVRKLKPAEQAYI